MCDVVYTVYCINLANKNDVIRSLRSLSTPCPVSFPPVFQFHVTSMYSS